ncbi:CoA-disulfide reductase [Virgibacillus oceani]|uniref:NADH dehydrogenase n=1 Tax=Virgibacillus oceani TaxID=1479511 RepID=A0A917HBX6_9BACI|nr:CoA-disulfide reductase [Virgibacillus oceani]GGG74652.1 NADH dehydrogenase [Virgibacillus oceani]
MPKKILIVGGVGGGSTVASQIRRLDQDSKIILFEKGEHIAFSNCGMPYFIGKTVKEREDLLRDADSFAKKYQVEVRINTKVTDIDRTTKHVTYETGAETHQESYDTLILSPGASAFVPEIKGRNENNSFTLRTIPDMDRINAFIKDKKPRSCAIVGGGFVGLEMAENVKKLNMDCAIIDRSEHVMKLVDKDMAAIIQEHLEAKGVNLLLKNSLDAFTDNGETLQLSDNKSLQADMTILAIGIKPNTKLADQAGLTIGKTGAIVVNEYMQTSDPDIYALGDAAETADYLIDTPSNVALAWPAHRQAYIIANHLADTAAPYAGTLGSSILKVFDLTVAMTGHNSASLTEKGIPFQEVRHDALSNAGYFPGAEKISIKLLFKPGDGKILGAQIIGEKGADKRLAVIATAIKGNLSVADLAELELAYAPPYSSPKDPLNIIGYKAESMIEKQS